MSTLGSIMNTALTAMTADQLALAVASNNISNSNDPNYTRQRLVTTPMGPDAGMMGIGDGVQVLGVQAIRDALVNARVQSETSAQSGADTLSTELSNIQSVFNDTSDTGLIQQLTDFFNSFQTLAQDPTSIPNRQQVQTNAQSLIDAFHARDSALTDAKTGADKAITADVAQINNLASQIADVTSKIKVAEVGGQPANDLRDQRAALVGQLSQYVQVREIDSDGDYQLVTQDNHLLVMNGTTKTLNTSDVTANIGAGSLKAEVDIRDTYVPKYTAALDQLAYEITQQVNAVHSAGYDLNGNTGINFFSTLSSASGAAQSISLSSAVANDVTKIAASSAATGSDGDTATQLGNLLHASVFTNGTVTDQYSSLVFNVGTDVSNAQSSLKEHQALLTQLQNVKQSVSGVSIDEETVSILQFQRSYQASARLIQTVDELLQTALAMGATTGGA
jgi:flagellar hook-associated protein 1 FlgK